MSQEKPKKKVRSKNESSDVPKKINKKVRPKGSKKSKKSKEGASPVKNWTIRILIALALVGGVAKKRGEPQTTKGKPKENPRKTQNKRILNPDNPSQQNEHQIWLGGCQKRGGEPPGNPREPSDHPGPQHTNTPLCIKK